MSAVIESALKCLVEGYTNPSGAQATAGSSAYTEAIAVVLAFVISLVLVSLIGMWLWNYSVVPLFEFARPAKSIFQILGLAIFLAIIMP